MTPEQLSEIQRLRDLKVAPKQIARKLGLKPAEVKLAVQEIAEKQQQLIAAAGELPSLEGCFANVGMVKSLLRGKPGAGAREGSEGMGAVLLARKHRNKINVSIFLVDHYCLGVKNAHTVSCRNAEKYQQAKQRAFESFSSGYEAISLAEAQAIVFGAVDYARSLGFEPHRDFERAKEILGERPDTLQALEFGKDGKPMYVSGPYDNPQKIMKTLDASVGKGNYHFLAEVY